METAIHILIKRPLISKNFIEPALDQGVEVISSHGGIEEATRPISLACQPEASIFERKILELRLSFGLMIQKTCLPFVPLPKS